MIVAIPHLAALAPPPGFEALPQIAVTVGCALIAFVLGRVTAGRTNLADVESQRDLWMARVYKAETRERQALQSLRDAEVRWSAAPDALDAAPGPVERLREVALDAAGAAVAGLRQVVVPRPTVEAEPDVLAEPEPLGGPFAEDLTIEVTAPWRLEDDLVATPDVPVDAREPVEPVVFAMSEESAGAEEPRESEDPVEDPIEGTVEVPIEVPVESAPAASVNSAAPGPVARRPAGDARITAPLVPLG